MSDDKIIELQKKADELIGQDWPRVVPLSMGNLPAIDPDLFPGWAGEFIKAQSTASETPPEMAASMLLAAASVACARRFRVHVRGRHYETSNLWIACVMSPGNLKSFVHDECVAPLKQWEREQSEAMAGEVRRVRIEREGIEERIAHLKKQMKKAEDSHERAQLVDEIYRLECSMPPPIHPPRLWTSDCTPERLGELMMEQGGCMAWLSDESGIFDTLAGRYNNGIANLDLVLTAYNGGSELVDRRSRERAVIENARLTIGLTPQPSVLEGLADRPGFKGRGFLDRFLFFMPPSPLGFRKDEPDDMPESVSMAYNSAIRAMLDWPEGDSLYLVRIGKDALPAYVAFRKAIERRMRPGEDLEPVSGWASKLKGTTARVAAILHAIEHAHGRPWETEINGETMERALSIVAVIIPHSLEVFGLAHANAKVSGAQTLWAWIERGRMGRVNLREAFNALRSRFPTMKELNTALAVLEERGYVREIVPQKGKRGRPSRWIEVNPEIRRGWA